MHRCSTGGLSPAPPKVPATALSTLGAHTSLQSPLHGCHTGGTLTCPSVRHQLAVVPALPELPARRVTRWTQPRPKKVRERNHKSGFSPCPQGHQAVSGDVCGCPVCGTPGGEWVGPGRLLTHPQCPGRPPRVKRPQCQQRWERPHSGAAALTRMSTP